MVKQTRRPRQKAGATAAEPTAKKAAIKRRLKANPLVMEAVRQAAKKIRRNRAKLKNSAK